MAGLSSLSNMANSLGAAEVKASAPIIGSFQWMATRGGLEAVGGVTIGSLVGGVVSEGLFGRVFGLNTADALPRVGAGLTSAIVMWELGRLVGSGGISN